MKLINLIMHLENPRIFFVRFVAVFREQKIIIDCFI